MRWQCSFPRKHLCSGAILLREETLQAEMQSEQYTQVGLTCHQLACSHAHYRPPLP